MRSIRIFAKNMGDPYYEPTIVVHDKANVLKDYVRSGPQFSAISRVYKLYTRGGGGGGGG